MQVHQLRTKGSRLVVRSKFEIRPVPDDLRLCDLQRFRYIFAFATASDTVIEPFSMISSDERPTRIPNVPDVMRHCFCRGVEVSESARVEVDRDALGLSRLERDLGEAFQFPCGTGDLGVILGHLDLRNVGAGAISAVAEVEGDDEQSA